jgi:toxin ParE1/3/4
VRLAWSALAVSDLVEVRRYIGDRNRSAARRVARRILESVNLLTRFPAIGRPGRVPHTRELVVTDTPYLVPYRVRGDVVEILRVLHGARRWPSKL